MICSQVGVMCILSATMFQYVNCKTEKCKWSNENCENNEDCCSGTCSKLHEGTDPRCADSPLYYPCFASYQCEVGLACGETYSCCSPFWGVCTDKVDCCDETHICREEEGFTYRRCLPGSSNHVLSSQPLLIFIIVFWMWILLCRTRIHLWAY